MKRSKTIALVLSTVFCFFTSAPAQTDWGTALSFDGVDDYVRIPGSASALSFPSRGPFSIEAWVNPASRGASQTIVSKYNGGYHGEYYFLIDTDGRLVFKRETAQQAYARSTAVLPTNQFSHVAATYDGTTAIVYINGHAAGEINSTSNISATTDEVRIGTRLYYSSPRDMGHGMIDEVRIWNTARSEAEIQAHMIQPLIGNEAGLVAYWKFDDGSGETATNMSSALLDGSLANGPVWVSSTVPENATVDTTNGNATVAGEVESYSIAGTNNSLVVGNLWWTNSANGVNGSLPVSGLAFEVSGIPLALGANTISVYGSNGVGTVVSDSATITRLFEHGLNSPIHYVATNGTAIYPYTSWETAATNIQTAIDTANAGDSVVVSNGTYNAGGAEVYSMSNRVVLAKAITVQSVNGPAATLIEGSGPNGPTAIRCAYVTNGAELIGFTLTNGHTHTSGNYERERSGGGVWMDQGGVVSNCTFSGNSANHAGGGLFCNQEGTLNNCILTNNSANYAGAACLHEGGMLNDCSLTSNSAAISGGGAYCTRGGILNNCTLTDNAATTDGGGIYCDDGGTLNHCTFSGNLAGYIGGGASCSGGGTLNHCTLSTNSADYHGGGVYCSGGTLNHCTLSNNVAYQNGGGAYCSSGGALNNCVLSNNKAVGNAGGAFCYKGGALNNCTLSGNLAGSIGGGAFCYSGGSLTNCIIWENSANSGANWHNEGTGMSYVYCCTTPAIGSHCITDDPLFANERNYRLLSGSPCIDAGMVIAGITDDLDGVSRPLDGDNNGSALYDIGAYEFDWSNPTSSGVDVRAFQTLEGVVVEFIAYDVEADGTIQLALLDKDGKTIWTGSVDVSAGPEAYARFLVPGLKTGETYHFKIRDEVGKWWDAQGVTVGEFATEMTRATLSAITLTFDSLLNHEYEILWSPTLGSSWTIVKSVTAEGNTTHVVIELSDQTKATGFFRVQLK